MHTQTGRWTENIKTEKQTGMKTDTWTIRQMENQIYNYSTNSSKTNRMTERQTHREIQKQRKKSGKKETEGQINIMIE